MKLYDTTSLLQPCSLITGSIWCQQISLAILNITKKQNTTSVLNVFKIVPIQHQLLYITLVLSQSFLNTTT